ncbi:hypothetical protein ACQP06_20365 [Nocardia sp. CA-136227]|uniref:hypothetical protein n=1 Tax=Nocardia sp. CA-136227 TaxID=3239979 RepID=UPI003D99D480
MRNRLRNAVVVGCLAIAATVPGTAGAEPDAAGGAIADTAAQLTAATTVDASKVVSADIVDDRNLSLEVYSAAMDKTVHLDA